MRNERTSSVFFALLAGASFLLGIACWLAFSTQHLGTEALWRGRVAMEKVHSHYLLYHQTGQQTYATATSLAAQEALESLQKFTAGAVGKEIDALQRGLTALQDPTSGAYRDQEAALTSLIQHWENVQLRFLESQAASRRNRNALVMLTLCTGLLLVACAALLMYQRVLQPLQKLTLHLQNISSGNAHMETSFQTHGPLAALGACLQQLLAHVTDAAAFAHSIGEGKFDATFEVTGEQDALGNALNDMRHKLMEVAEEEKIRNWRINGVARLSELIRDHQQSTPEQMAYAFISHFVRYTESNQGGVFLLNDENSDDIFLEQAATYAFNKQKFLEQRIAPGDGLVGQCFVEGETIYLEEVPERYISITSGLGDAPPRAVLLVPIKVNDQVYGVIELASFHRFKPYQIEFVSEVGETLGVTIAGIRTNRQTSLLLEESRRSNAELQLAEREMQQNAEELQATQEELNRRLEELREETNLSQCIIEAINKTNATVEFDMEGNITQVNNMYLTVMGYERDEMIGIAEAQLIAQDEANRLQFEMLWDSLRRGSYHGGEYRRMAKNGREVWLNGTYNPIFDTDGKPYKIIQFAQFVTDDKEKDLDLTSKINAMSQSFPMLDLDLTGNLIKANLAFVEMTGVKRSALRKMNLWQLLAEEQAEPAIYESIWPKIQEGESISELLPYRTGENEIRYCLTNFSPIRNLAGEVYKVMTMIIDITDQRKLQDELRMHQEQLSETVAELKVVQASLSTQKAELETRVHMLDQTTCIFEIDHKGKMLALNDSFRQCMNLADAPLDKLKLTDLIATDLQAENILAVIQATAQEGALFRQTLPYRSATGTMCWGDTTIARVPVSEDTPNGAKQRYLGILFDVTQQVAQESELRKSLARERMKNAILDTKSDREVDLMEKLLGDIVAEAGQTGSIPLNSLMEHDSLPMLHLDAEGNILHVNPSAHQFIGYTHEELENQSFLSLLDFPDKEAQKHFVEQIQRGDVQIITLSMRLRYSIGQQVQTTLIPVFTSQHHQVLAFLNPL
ncbi:PAS domain S-box-containing protein [Catalinimonas alkaloidigena]|uniref:PAS domain S-box-containing protein n=1 Tax=Catalinimonas alkaloidigena TaxID=1075417 RepID=A0A1G9BRP1_9BACT|nr:PAS domain S-box protein [Catalinimonas alkaloidigena]SDK42132.1 PAS domain S-box-containing protein [Catalinimonas alkaloidigena]